MNDFSDALRTAIRRSGLSLEDIATALRHRGTPVCVSTLSNWQTGGNLPERAGSLAALARLEELLGLPGGSTVELLPPRRPRGRWRARHTDDSPMEQTWNTPAALAKMLARVDAAPDDLGRPTKVSQFASYTVDAQGHERSIRMRRLLLGDRDSTGRMLYAMRYTTMPQPPIVTFTDGCRPGRFRADAATATCVMEFILDRPLARGELSWVEFHIQSPPGQHDQKLTLRAGPAARDMVMSVGFHPDKIPTRCYGYHQTTKSSERQLIVEQHGGTAFQFITIDPTPGIYGVRWEFS